MVSKRKQPSKRRKIDNNNNNHINNKDGSKVEKKVDEVITTTATEKALTIPLSYTEKAADGQEDAQVQQQQPPPTTTVDRFVSDGRYRNKQRCLVLCSRGVTARYRHLLEDLRTLMPHHKKESKLDAGDTAIGQAVSDIAEMRSCNTVLFLETRKRQDAYMWMAKVGGSGPSVRFHVTNIHTMDELRLTGNCMKGSRPILSFDDSFQKVGHLKLLKELFVDVFGTPRGHPKCKPFVDRIMCFYYADKKIWVRNYQILEQLPTNALEASLAKKASSGDIAGTTTTSLVEIGPRFVLNPIRIFQRPFGGQTLYRNEDFVSPNEVRALERKAKGRTYIDRKEAEKTRKRRREEMVLPDDPLDSVFR